MQKYLFVSPCLVLALHIACQAAEPAPQGAKKPNVVILLADDLGYADVGFQGCRDIPTPHIDSLAQNGVRCTNGYVSGPYCSPTRAGLLTGRYQQRFGHEFNPSTEDSGLALTETTMAERFADAGYATGLVGKWHLGGLPKFRPPQRGFGDFFGFLGGAHAYFPQPLTDVYRGDKATGETGYLTDAFGREAVAFIDRHKSRPFFLYLAFNAVHTPMQATDERLKRFESIDDPKRRTYAAMLVAMDEAIGQVLGKLHAEGLDRDTLIFFFSDNGGPTMKGTTINGSRNTPLRGSKRTTLEGGVRVPFVVQWPARLSAGKVYDQPIIQLDIQPTALAAAGIAAQPNQKLDGVNLLPFLSGETAAKPHETLYWRLGEQMAIRDGDWKLVRYDSTADGETGGAVTPPRLYDLAHDVGEAHDLTAEQPDTVKKLEMRWQAWSNQMASPAWGPGGRTK